jgi:hypothetical protein
MDQPAGVGVRVPWDKIDVVDRGFGECWVYRGGYNGHWLRFSRAFWREHFGENPQRSEGRGFNHVCEIHGEKNLCLNPEHVFVGDWSTNAKTFHERRKQAGKTHYNSEESRQRVVDANSAPKSFEHKQALSVSAKNRWADPKEHIRQKCSKCGRMIHPLWVKRHAREHE